jgi:PPOX class probable F420-dependent enzyme
MSEAEVRDFLTSHETVILCSTNRDGVPHPMPMWYAVDADGSVVMTTFRKSQKVRNLERDPRVSLLVEDGGGVYEKLRGVVLYGRAELTHDTEAVLDVLSRVTGRYRSAAGADPALLRNALRGQAAKRVAIRVRPERVVSWDHGKLGGVY